MNKNVMLLGLSIFLLMGIACASKTQQVGAEKNSPAVTDADNTARNSRDYDKSNKTSLAQAENPTDLRISAEIRQAVVGDKSLSVNAHNVKIITAGGTVTLRGPVKSKEEKTTIEAKAKLVAGVTRVDNLLEVEANP